MQFFPATELQRNSAEIQKAALMGLVFLSVSRQAPVRDDVAGRIRSASRQERYAPSRRLSGSDRDLPHPREGWRKGRAAPARAPAASAVDKLVLATVNAPYKRSIDAAALAELPRQTRSRSAMAGPRRDVLYRRRAGTGVQICRPARYLEVSARQSLSCNEKRTGEQNPVLETDLVAVAHSSGSNHRRPRGNSRPVAVVLRDGASRLLRMTGNKTRALKQRAAHVICAAIARLPSSSHPRYVRRYRLKRGAAMEIHHRGV